MAATSGFSDATDRQLMEAAGVSTAEEWQKCVVLILDEMHVREDLVYEKHTGALIGFTDFGDINNHLLQLERSLDEKSANEPLANGFYGSWPVHTPPVCICPISSHQVDWGAAVCTILGSSAPV